MRSDDILEQLDHVLDDATVGPDAVRYNGPPPLDAWPVLELSGEQLAYLRSSWAP